MKIYDSDNFQLLWKNLPYDTWTHLVITNETVNGTYYLKIYKDGKLYDSASKSGNGLSIRSGQLILGSGVESANGSVYFSDFRIYDHTLSQKEVTEMSRGCILHYPCNDILNEGTVNLVNSISAGGQTTISNGVVTTSGVNADTYFTLNLSESITEGTQYTISCETNMPSGTYWDFPLGSQGNTNLTWRLKPGYNTYTFTANGISWGTQRIFMDDVQSTARTSGYQCKFFNFQLEKKDHATVYTPSSRTQTQLKDVSGFDNHSTITGSLPLVTTPKSARYDKCMNIDNSGTNKNYANCTIAAPQVKAASFWLYIGNSNPINQILFVDLASNMGFGFNSIGNIISHTTTGPYIPSVFSGSTTIKNSWNHFVINHLGTSTELYLNGDKLSSTTNDGWTNNVNGFYFGRRVKTDYDYYYTGKVSDFRLFSRVLSQHDVDDLYKDSFAIDNNQNGFIYELNESSSQSTVEVKKNGQLLCSDYEEGQLLMLKMYWNGDIDEYELDYQDYYAYEGKTTIWEGQKCYIWQRYDAGCEAYDYENTDNSENIILTNTLNIKMPFNGSSPEFVAAIGLDGNECYNEPRLAMWADYDSEGEYSGMIKLEGVENSSEVARICKSGKVTTKEIYEI